MGKERCRSGANSGDTVKSPDDITSGGSVDAGSEVRRDVMSVEKRSALMSRIKGRDTGPEKRMRALLQQLDLEFAEQDRGLPGRPDFVLTDHRLVILVDGDFWHGWQFEAWKHKLAPSWRRKIAANIRRDRRNRIALKAAGWSVMRVWEHQLERSPDNVRRRLRARIRRAAAIGNLANPGQGATQDADVEEG